MGEPPPFGLPVCHHILPRCFPCCKKDMQCRDSSRETRAGNGCPASAWEPMRWTFFAVNSPGYPVKVLVLGFVRPTAVFFFRLALTKLFFFGPQKVCLHGFEVFFVSPQRPWVQRKKKKKKTDSCLLSSAEWRLPRRLDNCPGPWPSARKILHQSCSPTKRLFNASKVDLQP